MVGFTTSANRKSTVTGEGQVYKLIEMKSRISLLPAQWDAYLKDDVFDKRKKEVADYNKDIR